MLRKLSFWGFAFLFSGLFSCKKDVKLPNTPSIEFIEFRSLQTDSAKLVFSFADGDGDIGLRESDINPPFDSTSVFRNNLFLTYFEKENNAFKEIPVNPPFHYRIPRITPSGRDKSLQGRIEVTLPFFKNPFSKNKFYMFEIYIVDRALNKSNIISTGEIPMPE